MRGLALLLVLVLLLISTNAAAYSRPSFRSIRENAEEQGAESDPGWRMQFYRNDDWGVRVAYPESWNPPLLERGTSGNGTRFAYARLIPHDAGYGKRRNYILELSVGTWDIGRELNTSELDIFSQRENSERYREFWVLNLEITELKGFPAVRYDIDSMTGLREEYWISAGRYVYILGFRTLEDYRASDHFFYEDMLDSLVLEAKPVKEEAPAPAQIAPGPQPVNEATANTEEANALWLFSDIAPDHPYASAIAWAASRGIVQGYPDGTFQPDHSVNRAEFLKIILGAAGITVGNAPPTQFPDVPENAWYAPYVSAAKALGIVSGYQNGMFRPEQPVNGAEALKMAYRAFGVETDERAGPWYERYLDHARRNGVLFSGDLDPSSPMTRKNVVGIAMRLALLLNSARR